MQARLNWVQRAAPRKFGKVLPGEIATCQEIASAHGIVLDPVWTLAAWESAVAAASPPSSLHEGGLEVEGAVPDRQGGDVIMIHTGGTMGLFGLAQRYPQEF